jgi:hypothetical protein
MFVSQSEIEKRFCIYSIVTSSNFVLSENHTYFKDVKEILRIFSTSCRPFENILAKNMFTKKYLVIVILVNTGLVKSRIYYWM